MPVTISFELSDRDIEHFVAMARNAQSAIATDKHSADEIAAGARGVFEASQGTELPDFIAERLGKLNVLAQMISDDEWRLPEDDLDRVLSAMAYFANPNDLIPDRVPGVGFLDDAIMADLVIQNLDAEIDAYNEFCAFRSAEEVRRANRGMDADVGREDWLAAKRSALQRRMRERRTARASRGGWRTKLW